MEELRVFEAVDFQWTQNLDSVWQDLPYDVDSLHRRERQGVLAKVREMAASTETGSPLGRVFVGPAGIGKTHMLSAIRREVLTVPATFILVDLIDVRDFWETALLGFIDSLQRPSEVPDRTQAQQVVQHLAAQVMGESGAEFSKRLATTNPIGLARAMDELVQRLGRIHRAQTLKHADALRALVLLNSIDLDLCNLGYAWLQGYGVDESDMGKFGFNIREKRPSAVVEGLSWLISLRSPMVIALDQLDPVVQMNAIATDPVLLAAAGSVPEEVRARQLTARSLLDGLGRGLMELRDVTRRALAVVSCLQETWGKLENIVLKSTTHRYEDQRPLDNVSTAETAEQLVVARLKTAYARHGFRPPYASWPFVPAAFGSAAGISPRELLRRCDKHRRRCVEAQHTFELTTFDEAPPRLPDPAAPPQRAPAPDPTFEAEFKLLRAAAQVPRDTQESDSEEQIGKLLLAGCELVALEQPREPSIDIVVEADGGIGRGYPALHARVRQIFTAENDRERHLCLRAIWRDHHIAFQARLTAAVTASGIDRQIAFRKLLLMRNTPVPSGAKTNALMTRARAAGAEMIAVSDEELLTLDALSRLREQYRGKRELFEQWLRARTPASALAVMKPVVEWLGAEPRPAPPAPRPPGVTPAAVVSANGAPASTPPANALTANTVTMSHRSTTIATMSAAPSPPTPSPPRPASPPSPPAVARPTIPVGRQVIADRLAAPQTLLAEDLRQHVVVLAGAGSGKTVLLRRLIEEAALIGVPSIVVDGANDLGRLGEPWPTPPDSFTDEDAAKAARYHAQTDVIVWTPGRSSGNPLHLGLIPDFAAVEQEPEELTQTIAMTAATLASMAGKRGDDKGRAILDAALRLFAQQGGGDLAAFLDVLADLPEEASLKISTARKVAVALSDSLRAAVQNNPLLHEEGEPLDPGILFGLGSPRARVSVLSMVGLPGLDAPLQFVNQLAMTLFTWVKKHPCPSDRPLRGLLVIDEAKDFVPSQGSTPCKESLIRLAAQGRKYGLGVVFATQAPRSIDHNVIANASTQFYGKASSPSAIDTVNEQLRARGGTKFDVATLPSGRFYMAGKGMTAPVKIAVPLCLSHHPASPPDEADVVRRARASRARLNGGAV